MTPRRRKIVETIPIPESVGNFMESEGLARTTRRPGCGLHAMKAHRDVFERCAGLEGCVHIAQRGATFLAFINRNEVVFPVRQLFF